MLVTLRNWGRLKKYGGGEGDGDYSYQLNDENECQADRAEIRPFSYVHSDSINPSRDSDKRKSDKWIYLLHLSKTRLQDNYINAFFSPFTEPHNGKLGRTLTGATLHYESFHESK